MSYREATAVTPRGDGTYLAEIHPGWDILGVTNGGYLMGMAARAMASELQDRKLVSVTGHFLNPGRPGSVVLSVDKVKEGREFATLRTVMKNAEEKPLVSVTGSFSALGRPAEDASMLRGKPPEVPPPDECERAASSEEAPFPPPFTDRIDLRVHPDDAGGALGQPSGNPLFRGWFRLLDDEPVDDLAVVLASDAFPPAVFNSGLPMAWTPTLDLTVHVRDPGPHEWLKCSFETRFVTGGLLEEDGEIWDADGNLVSLSRQLALVGR